MVIGMRSNSLEASRLPDGEGKRLSKRADHDFDSGSTVLIFVPCFSYSLAYLGMRAPLQSTEFASRGCLIKWERSVGKSLSLFRPVEDKRLDRALKDQRTTCEC